MKASKYIDVLLSSADYQTFVRLMRAMKPIALSFDNGTQSISHKKVVRGKHDRSEISRGMPNLNKMSESKDYDTNRHKNESEVKPEDICILPTSSPKIGHADAKYSRESNGSYMSEKHSSKV